MGYRIQVHVHHSVVYPLLHQRHDTIPVVLPYRIYKYSFVREVEFCQIRQGIGDVVVKERHFRKCVSVFLYALSETQHML